MKAQHQNSKAERAIQTIMYMARTFLVHSSLHWTDMGADDISLWPFAVKHAVWLYNRFPNQVQSNLDSEGAISCAIPKCQSCELARA